MYYIVTLETSYIVSAINEYITMQLLIDICEIVLTMQIDSVCPLILKRQKQLYLANVKELLSACVSRAAALIMSMNGITWGQR